MKRWLLLVLLLLAAGCARTEPTGPLSVTGQQGVVVEEVQVPSTIYQGEEFTLTYALSNEGAYGVSRDEPGYVFVSHDPLYFEYVGLTSRFSENAFFLDGRTPFYEGEDAFVNLHFRARPIERFSERISSPVLATVCYPYASNVTADVCIEQNRNVDQGAIACRNAPVRPPSPGAPIGVEEVVVRSGRADVGGEEAIVPQFRITLRNYGDGVPSVASCVDGDSSLLNTAGIRVSVLNEELACVTSNEEGFVRFSRGRALVTCTVPDASTVVFPATRGNFQSLLSVDLDYTYRESVRTELEVQR